MTAPADAGSQRYGTGWIKGEAQQPASRISARNGEHKGILGGEKRSIRKPSVRSNDGMELSLPALAIFQDEESLSRAVLSELLAGVSTWKYARAKGFDGIEAVCTSKSEVSRKFVKGLSALMDESF